MTPIPETKDPREAAYLALLASQREERFISDTLDQWRTRCAPSPLDFNFAQQIAYGSSQMALALDFMASQLATNRKLTLKLKERLLLRLALYQFYYLERVPIYAISDEMLSLAKKYCHQLFANFLNAILRKLPQSNVILPQGDAVEELSIRYSYPQLFVDLLIKHYGLETAKEILKAGNKTAPLMVRIRPNVSSKNEYDLEPICELPFPIGIAHDHSSILHIASSSDHYIQNATPATLLGHLCQAFPYKPTRILDLCASPGGKLIAAHDFFPNAALFGNDISEEKLKRLKENCQKYGLNANFSVSLGEEFTSEHPFDIIILDVPCSNSGVLNKRAEARWRLTKDVLEGIEKVQFQLLKHAKTLLSPTGEIWYMTCSILPQENEELVRKACQALGLEIKQQETILPNSAGWDGGFAAALRII